MARPETTFLMHGKIDRFRRKDKSSGPQKPPKMLKNMMFLATVAVAAEEALRLQNGGDQTSTLAFYQEDTGMLRICPSD